jgi:G:T-mismatch repair DNA endonuclease (very short patch repair protein)
MSVSRKKLMVEDPEMREQALVNLQKARKSMTRPNKKEIEIGKILEGIGIKFKFLQEVDYETLENKTSSKKIDIVWKDSVGNKKIIEYNGRYHFDPRDHKPDEIHEVHNKPTKCQDIWDEENMILNQIRKTGYKILVVWQKDFLKDYENEQKRIIEFATKT